MLKKRLLQLIEKKEYQCRMYIKYILIFWNISIREYEEMDYNVNMSVLDTEIWKLFIMYLFSFFAIKWKFGQC